MLEASQQQQQQSSSTTTTTTTSNASSNGYLTNPGATSMFSGHSSSSSSNGNKFQKQKHSLLVTPGAKCTHQSRLLTTSPSCSTSSSSSSSTCSSSLQLAHQHQQLTQSSINSDQSQHSEFILNGLQILKSNNILCDVTLIAENKRFQVHKILLASVSDYFRSMFTSGMKETNQSDIELKGVSARGLEKVIEIIYTSQTSFESYTDLFDVISAANHLQCLLVIDYCEKNFLSRLTCKNFNYFIRMAKLYRMPNALKQIDLFIVQNLAKIINQANHRRPICSSSFPSQPMEIVGTDVEEADDDDEPPYGLRCLTYEQLIKCLAHDQLKMKEIDLFLLTWKWINENLLTPSLHKTGSGAVTATMSTVAKTIRKKKKNKKKYFLSHMRLVDLNQSYKTESKSMRKIDIIRNLLKLVRFALISPGDIVQKVQNINTLMISDRFLRKLVLNALNYHLMPNVYHSHINSTSTLRMNSTVQQFDDVKSMDEDAEEDDDDEDDLDFDTGYLPSQYDRCEMGEYTMNLNVRSPVRSILAIGGREINPFPTLHDNCYLLNDVFLSNAFNFTHNSNGTAGNKATNITVNSSLRKLHLTNVPCVLSHMQSVVVNNFLYVLGGCVSQCAHGESAVSTSYRYDPRLNKWSNVNAMLDKRAYFYACSLDLLVRPVGLFNSNANSEAMNLKRRAFVFSFGGKNRDGSLCSVEKYDIEANQWSYVQPMPASYYAHAGAVLNNIAYVSGGYTHGHFTPDLHAYVPGADQWEELRPMHAARGWHSMCAANDCIYVIGGCYLNQTSPGQLQTPQPVGPPPAPQLPPPGAQQPQQMNHQMAQPVTVTEFYSPHTDQWTVVKPMVNLHKEAYCFRYQHYVYVCGGYNIAAKTGQKLVSRYDFLNDLWTTVGQLSSGMTGVSCCFVDLPWYVFESNPSGDELEQQQQQQQQQATTVQQSTTTTTPPFNVTPSQAGLDNHLTDHDDDDDDNDQDADDDEDIVDDEDDECENDEYSSSSSSTDANRINPPTSEDDLNRNERTKVKKLSPSTKGNTSFK